MNGDLSLSQSLGGLRIANPDGPNLSSPSPQPQNVALNRTPSSTRAPPPSDPQPNLYRDEHIREESPGHSSVDVRSLGFDPTSYIISQPPPHSQYPAPSPRSSSQRLNPRNSTSFAQDAQQQQPYYNARPQPRSYINGPLRPNSGLYNPPSVSNNQGHTPESAYSRVRSESTQSTLSTSSGVRRSDSKAGAPVPLQVANNPAANGAPYRQHSNSSPAANQPFPPRRSSKTRQHPEEIVYPPAHPSSLPTNMEVPLSSSQEWQEKGAAVGVKNTVDANGKTTSKVVKKGVKDFQFGRTLGEGSYSTVMAATDRVTGKEYAIKILDKRHIIKEKKVKYVNIEKDTLNRLTEHPGIVRLYYTFQDERSLYFVLDLAAGGELLGVLKKMTTFDEECTRFYGAQILDSIEYMHLRGIIHRDLKPENVLLDDQGYVKITDFGTAKILDLTGKAQFGKVSVSNDPMDGADTNRAVSFVGTAEYVSPELLTDKNACKASDLWAFGCIVYQLLAGRPPFKAVNEYQTFQKIVNLDYSFPDGFPSIARDLVTRLLVLDPAQRLPIDDIKAHPFFAGIQWGKGLWKQKAPKLRCYNPATGHDALARDHMREPMSSALLQPQANTKPSSKPTSSIPNSTPPRPQPRIITELAPPSQLDIDWSPVLTKSNERIAKLGQLVVYSTPAPHSPTSKNNSSADQPSEQPSKFSRFFGANVTKKRQRLVMITSSARLVLAPAGGDRKEAKQIINLTDADVLCRSQQDTKGYTVWCVFTKDKHYTFEDPKANTGEAGSSMRSTQEWLDRIQEVKDYLPSQQRSTSDHFSNDSYSGLDPSMGNSSRNIEGDESPRPDTVHQNGRKMLRKEPITEDEGQKGRKRFSRRHSKNGLAAVF